MSFPSFPFPSRFAVFRGPPPTNSVPFEWIDSIMMFDSTECEDETNGEYYAFTLRPWPLGAFILDENPTTPDTTIYEVKIQSQSSWADDRHYMRMPYSITKHQGENTGLFEFNIPVLAFQSTDWMHQTTYPIFRHVVQSGEASLLHIRQMVFLCCERMRLHPNITRFLETHENLYDLIHYTSPSEIERTQGQHISFWYDRLFRMPVGAPQLEPLASAPPLSEISSASSSDEETHVLSEPVQEQSSWPVFVYQNHVRMEMSKGTECPITLTKLAEMTEFAISPKCGHIFEPAALTKWLHDSSTRGEQMVCPLCRTEVPLGRRGAPNGAMFIRFGTD